jgi:EmrB/QacA subfamily drug resistance transporter
LTFATSLITGGRLGDIYGRRRMFMAGLAAFIAASTLCGVAPTPTILILARLLQGLAAAVLSPQVMALLRVTFTDPRERATAFSLMGVTIGLATVVGQVLGGFIVQADLWGLAWRPVFLINIPLGLAALTIAPSVLTESRAPHALALDLNGVLFSTAGLGLILYPLIRGHEAGWPSWYFGMGVAGVLLFAIFLWQQERQSTRSGSPLLDLGLFRDRAFSVGAVMTLLFYATLTPFFLIFTLLLQLGLGCTPMQAGLELSVLAVTFSLASFAAGKLAARGARPVLFAGATVGVVGGLLAIAAGLFAQPLGASHLLPALIVLGIGEGLFMTPSLNFILSSIPDRHAGSASGVLTTMQRMGGSFGVALLGLLFFDTRDHLMAAGITETTAYVRAFVAAATGVTLLMAALLPLLWLVPRRPT